MRFNTRARTGGDTERRRGVGGSVGGSGGALSLGGLLVIGAVFLIGQFTGLDVGGIIGAGGGAGSGSETADEITCTGADANRLEAADGNDDCAIALVTTSVQDYWEQTFAEQGAGRYEPARTIVFSGTTSSGCGAAQAAMGPFYCPNDRLIYLDTDFVKDMLQGQLGARGGDFALAYVIAHEYGHHVENLLGYLGRTRTQTGPRSDAVRIELMADCLGGMWARGATSTRDDSGVAIIEDLTRDDIARAIDAARAVGDDRIQKKTSGRVDPDAWTHGSAEQRAHWFNVGLEEGSLRACDTFTAGAL